jgi:hypothetical protein
MNDLIKYKIAIHAWAMVILLGSCTDRFEEINTNPNFPTDVPAINIFTRVISNSVTLEVGWTRPTGWSQQWCGAQYAGWDKYWFGTSYNLQNNYANDLLDLEIIINKTTENIKNGLEHEIQQSTSLLAAAKIMRVWIFHLLTDMFGNIPYSEALQGLDPDGLMTPKYDTQESIYMDLLHELDEANSLLDLSFVIQFGKGDLLFGGDPAKWKKFGNSLKLRILNRCSGTPWSFTYDMVGTGNFTTTPGVASYPNADNEIATVLDNPSVYPIISANDENAQLSYPGLPYRQPIFSILITAPNVVISETMVDWLKARNDPRLPVFAQETPDYVNGVSTDPYVGEQNGRDQITSHFPAISLLGVRIGYDETAPFYVLTYDEIEFIKAEHYMRLGNETSARAAYEAGIAASMERWGVSHSNYLSEPQVDWDSATSDGEIYQHILEQKWAGMFGQGWQAWHEVRRTGFPARIFEYELEDTYYPDMGMPVRIGYPEQERIENGVNLAEAQKTQNIESSNDGLFSTDGIKSQMWWHTRKNPIPTETDVPGK